ncbi:MAG: hypothetical protein NTZ14_01180 [Hyphomicrobiales bacterium]|nr:hypothetical protein [Hyphomicrobiales bacterium]
MSPRFAMPRCRQMALACAILWLTGGQALATSPMGLGFQRFTATGPKDALGRGVSDMLDTDMVTLLNEGANSKCNLAVREVKRMDDILKELELQKSPQFDQSKRVIPNFIELRFSATGHVVTTENSMAIDIKITDTRSNKVVASFEATLDPESQDILKTIDQAVKSILDQLCPRAHRLNLSVGPHFVIDTEVCDITKPFQARPKGGFSGVQVSFTPRSREAGSFTEAGKAYGAQWNGRGDYTIAWSGDSGRFQASNPNTVLVVGRRVQHNDVMTGTVTRLPRRCPAG